MGALPGVLAVALIGFDRTGRAALWIGDDRIAPEEIRVFLDGGDDPHERLALAVGGTLRASPLAGGSAIAGVLQLVSARETPRWRELALIGAQISSRLAVLGIDAPLSDHAEPVRLSERQHEIALLVARGCTNAEIATMVGCTAHAVKKQLSRVCARLEVTNRTELAALVARWAPAAPSAPTRRQIYRSTRVVS